jgi:hypothetical protein
MEKIVPGIQFLTIVNVTYFPFQKFQQVLLSLDWKWRKLCRDEATNIYFWKIEGKAAKL